MTAIIRQLAFATAIAVASACLALATPPAARAQTAGQTSGSAAAPAESLPQQVPLTPALVEGFIASYPELHALGDELEQKYGQVDADPEDPSSIVTGYARYAEAKDQIEGIIQKHGIASLQDWLRTAYSVMLAYSFSERGEGAGNVDSEMAEAIDQIKNDQSIPADQKTQLIAMLEQQMAQISKLRPPQGNIEVVNQYADQIREIADSE